MTQDEIIEMARQAGFKMENSAAIQAAEIFYKLVAAKEREALAQPPRPMQECPNYEDCKGACFQCEYFNAETGTLEYPPLSVQPTEKQEPVAIVTGDAWETDIRFLPEGIALPPDTKLYTHPQRTWAGLTEERIRDIWLKGKDHGDDWQDVLALARSFEAELKGLNT